MDTQVLQLASPSGVPHHCGQPLVDHVYYLWVAESDPWLVESADAETMDRGSNVQTHMKFSVRL